MLEFKIRIYDRQNEGESLRILYPDISMES